MVHINAHTSVHKGRLISFGFADENPDVSSVFSNLHTLRCRYRLMGIIATLPNGEICGGINGNLLDGCFYLDEIWVKPKNQGVWVGKQMISYLHAQLKQDSISLFCYPHLMYLEGYFQLNGCSQFRVPRKKAK